MVDRTIRNTRTDTNFGGTGRFSRRLAKLARAAFAGLRQWAEPAAYTSTGPRLWAEVLEERQLFTFDLTVAGPPSATANVQFDIYAWTSGGTMTGNYTVVHGDGTTTYVPYSTIDRVTAIPITYTNPGSYAITVSASTSSASCTQSLGLEDVGNYPSANAGPTTYLPGSATTSSAADVVVDPANGDTYVGESYYTSGGGYQMALTRLDSNDIPDTAFGTLVSGTTHTGTYLVSSFGGGSDVPYAAAVLDSGGVDEVALAGHSAHGMAVAIIDVSGAGALVNTSDYGSQTMPSGTAYAVTADSSNDFVAAGTNSTQTDFVAVALYGVSSGTTVHAGEIDASFGSSGSTSCDFGSAGGNGAAALAIMQEPDPSNGFTDLVLGGWYSPGCTGCSSCGSCTYSCCAMVVLGLDDAEGSSTRGAIDTAGFGSGPYTGYNGTWVSGDFNGCSGTGLAANSSVYSLAWDDELSSYAGIMAIGGTNYSGTNQFALWAMNPGGVTFSGFGNDTTLSGVPAPYGVAVPNVNATAAGGTVDTWEGNGDGVAPDGYVWLVGTMGADMFIGRTDFGTGTLDPYFGQVTSAGSTTDLGYFTQDLGTATTNSSDTGHAITTEADGSVVIVGNTSGGKIAVARYLENNFITVLRSGEGIRASALAEVQAASQPSATFSSGPAITSDSTANDLSPPDGSGGQNALHKRLARRRPPALLATSPPA
jgi:hypothetical protein